MIFMSGSMPPKELFTKLTGLKFEGTYEKYYLETYFKHQFVLNINNDRRLRWVKDDYKI